MSELGWVKTIGSSDRCDAAAASRDMVKLAGYMDVRATRCRSPAQCEGKAAVKQSIERKKIPSYEFYPDEKPSVADAAKMYTQGADGKELEVQATLIVKGSDFDLGPFLSP